MTVCSTTQLLAIIVEDEYGTDPLSGADPSVFLAPVRDSVTVLEHLAEVQDPAEFAVQATRESQFYGDYTEVSFQIPLTGKSGAAGTAPEYSALLEAVGLIEVVDAGVKVQYNPRAGALNAPDGDTSFTLVFYEFDDETADEAYEHRITGCRGNLRIILNQGQPAILEFTGAGLYSAPPTATSTPPTNPTAYQADANSNFLKVQGVTHTIGGTAAFFQSITIDLGWQVGMQRYGNGAAAVDEVHLHRSGNPPVVSYVLKSDENTINTWVGAITTADTYALVCSLTDGTDTVAITAPVLQPKSWTKGTAEGRKVVNLEASLHGNFGTSAGADYIQLTYT